MVKNKRIQFLASLLEGYDTVIDIGSDHGYVLREAFEQKFIKQAIASDLRSAPLERAMITLQNYPVTFVQSDGFLAVKEPYQAAVISGMGAYLIADIMKYAPMLDALYILQPNDKPAYLREKMMDLGYQIVDEYVIHDRFYYVVILYRYGKEILSLEDIILGPKLKDKKEALTYYQRRIFIIDQIQHKAPSTTDKKLNEELEILLKQTAKLKAKE